MVKKLFIILFLLPLFLMAEENYIPQSEQCTYENDKLWIQTINYCPEGYVHCHLMLYVSINKENGQFNVMRGETLNIGKNINAQGMQFYDNKYNYVIADNEPITMEIFNKKNREFIKSIPLRYCSDETVIRDNPQPEYPKSSLLNQEQGTVKLKILVGTDGIPLTVDIVQSSGFDNLDNIAKKTVLEKYQFKPKQKNGKNIRTIYQLKIHFTLPKNVENISGSLKLYSPHNA